MFLQSKYDHLCKNIVTLKSTIWQAAETIFMPCQYDNNGIWDIMWSQWHEAVSRHLVTISQKQYMREGPPYLSPY